jgi:pimeloyl-ACP methyl ester carboxylesterase
MEEVAGLSGVRARVETAPAAQKSAPPRWRRYLFRGMAALVFAYVGVLLLLMLCENLFVFPGTPAWLGWADKPVPEMQDVELRLATGTKIHGWFLPCAEPRATVLFLHGSGGNISFGGPLLVLFRDRHKVATLGIDYPGYGKSEGWCSEQGCYDAAEAAYQWLLQQKIPARDIVILGDSLGAAIAVDLASRRDHRALVLVKPFTRMPDVASLQYPMYPIETVMRNRFESIKKIPLCQRPILIAHGTVDTLVPCYQGGQLYDAAREPKRFLPMPGEGHCLHFPECLLKELESFVVEGNGRGEVGQPPTR